MSPELAEQLRVVAAWHRREAESLRLQEAEASNPTAKAAAGYWWGFHLGAANAIDLVLAFAPSPRRKRAGS